MSALDQTVPEGYKQTEVGVIPTDWKSEQLGHHVEICSGESPSRFNFKSEGIPYFKVEQLNNHPVYAEATPYFIESTKVISSGSVIFPKRGASILSNKIRILKHDSFMDTNLMTLTCNESLKGKYLYNQLTYRGLDSVADTTSIPQINNKHIIPFYIPVPDVEEQTAIANALSDVDALLTELEKLIAKKQAIKTATMQQLLTGKTRLTQFITYTEGEKQGQPKGTKTSELGEIPEDWDVVSIAKLTRNIIDYRGRTPKKLGMDWGGGDIVALSAGNVKKGYIDFEEECYLGSDELYKKWMKNGDVEQNDIVFTMEASLGNVALVPDSKRYILSQRTILLQLKREEYESTFVYQLMMSDQFQKLLSDSATGSTAQGIKRTRFEQLLLCLPSSKEEQTAIATILSDMDNENQTLKQRLAKTRQIKQGMMQELLTGRTRLPFEKEK